ncbi:hypothetical protein PR048_031403 [Dryococelus australis]|uniref:Uncharacterized protein n=1 Tax=Dryococelus australis TaxID=614101 RepID=A0ABQ9G981_9NEOP|nr:hypothetical protein PR048_031403 [Dryococelus australis]
MVAQFCSDYLDGAVVVQRLERSPPTKAELSSIRNWDPEWFVVDTSACLARLAQIPHTRRKLKRLACSSPTKANRFESPAGSLPDFRMRESYRTMPLVGGFSQGSPISSTLSFRRCSILTSTTHVGSQDLVVKRRSNLFTDSYCGSEECVYQCPYNQGGPVCMCDHVSRVLTERTRCNEMGGEDTRRNEDGRGNGRAPRKSPHHATPATLPA